MNRTHAASQRRAHCTRAVAALAAAAFCLAAALPTAASADVGMQIIERCGHEQSISGYTVAQYKQALNEMEAEVIEYSDCAEVIRQAELKAAAAGGKTGSTKGGSGGGATPGTAGPGGSSGGGAVGNGNTPIPFLNAAEQHTVEAARNGKAAPVHVGPGTVLPGVVHVGLASAASSLPMPLLAAIVLVCLGLLLLVGREIKDRIAKSRPAR